ncbi:ADP-ribosylglycohydrolase family protein [Arthrobacter sp. H5]|uniref:ADP-ribosylglycohydrolase family protein n=1 Tax=Arthrobacter sp. H5 TaxID=1267973 RepID=UPI0004BAEA60|nr:ADP-ribosylglycohydrolase family protein [Arthrobacter sp. H5]
MTHLGESPDPILGCLLGGALGDALGYATRRHPESAVAQWDPAKPDSLRISARTQLTLYTVDGLTDALEWANDGVAADETACLWLAYLRWFRAQGGTPPSSAPVPPLRWIDNQAVLHHRRDPDAASAKALGSGEMGSRGRPLNPEAADAGAAARSAPFGLIPHIAGPLIDRLTMDAAALTHGHPSARHAAAGFSTLIHAVAVRRLPLDAAVDAAVERVSSSGGPELAAGLVAAAAVPPSRTPDAGSAVAVLATAVHAALSTQDDDGEVHFRAAVRLAAGRDDGTAASMTGNIVGALHGHLVLPQEWLGAIEGRDVVIEATRRLAAVTA